MDRAPQAVPGHHANTALFYREQTSALLALVGEDTPVSEVTLDDFASVVTGIQQRGRKIASPFRAMKAFLRRCG
ncbi:MAG TPA: hypothetical protein VET65_07465, partial [Candidatus Limnocylindrales bacterium]|nr:hypothetical protein [Candidatus Limnocylindrales bacterium]